MKAEQQIPRNALVWVIIAQFSLVAPHYERIPLWILLVYGFAAVWRLQVYAGRWSFPGRLVKGFLILSSFLGIYFSFGEVFGLEPTVALLLAAFALKLIELSRRKDAYVLIFLGYFVCATEFLFSQDLLIAVYSLFNIVVITTALIALHRPGEHSFNYRTVKLATVMLAQSIPLMVILFFIFPRIGPLWSVPLKSQAAKTGVSDFMRPGDISQLSQSADVAFRVQFEGEIPDKSELYWRGLVFSKLEDDAWTSLQYYDVPAAQRKPVEPERSGDAVRYSIIMAPTQQNWLYSLRYATPGESKIMRSADYRLYSPVIIEDEYRYSARSWTDTVLDPQLSDWRRSTELALPQDRNPRTHDYAQELREEYEDDAELIDAVLAKFNREPFVYTLKPPPLGTDSMDEFIFETRRGFCEHYAYAFVVMMRAAGIPARVVAGYQGGEVNPVNGTVIIHQFDAHAWAEVWLEGQGWVRVDPTASVAPERIEWGLEEAVFSEGSFLAESPLSPLRYRGVSWLNSVRLQYDALTWRWQSWIVGYDSEQQYDFLERMMGDFSVRKFAFILLGGWALVLFPVAFTLLRRRQLKEIALEDKYYLQFCERLAKRGAARKPGEAPGTYADRLAVLFPLAVNDIAQVTGHYSELAYGNSVGPHRLARLKEFKQQVRRFRLPATSTR